MTTPVVEDDVVEKRAIVFDGEKWFVRRVDRSVRNLDTGEMEYYCDKPISNAHETLADVPEVAALIEQQRKTIEELTSDKNDMWKSLREIDCLAIDASRSSLAAVSSGFIGSIVRITSRALLQGDKKE